MWGERQREVGENVSHLQLHHHLHLQQNSTGISHACNSFNKNSYQMLWLLYKTVFYFSKAIIWPKLVGKNNDSFYVIARSPDRVTGYNEARTESAYAMWILGE